MAGAADPRADGQVDGGHAGSTSIVLSQICRTFPLTHWQLHPASDGETAANPSNKTKSANRIFIAVPPNELPLIAIIEEKRRLAQPGIITIDGKSLRKCEVGRST